MRCSGTRQNKDDCGLDGLHSAFRIPHSAFIMRVDPERPDPEVIRQAAQVVRVGGVIGYPAETVYGLGADPYDLDAVRRVFDVKGREGRKGFILVVLDERMLMCTVAEVSPPARRLMDAFWPGPLTLIFRASADLPDVLLGGGDTVAVRRTSDPVAQALLQALKCPLISTSANRAGEPPCRSAAEVANTFRDRLDLILDDGTVRDQMPSSIVDVSSEKVRMVRAGAVTRSEVERVLGHPFEGERG